MLEGHSHPTSPTTLRSLWVSSHQHQRESVISSAGLQSKENTVSLKCNITEKQPGLCLIKQKALQG